MFLINNKLNIMKNLTKKAFYTGTWLALAGLNSVNAANYGLDKVRQDTGSTESADGAIQTLITNALAFLGVVAVLFIIYAGFMILTAGWDDEKVKKGKSIIIQALIWIVIIFLAYSIVNWIFTFITK